MQESSADGLKTISGQIHNFLQQDIDLLELPEIIEKTLKTLKAIGNLYCAFKKSGKNKSNANQTKLEIKETKWRR